MYSSKMVFLANFRHDTCPYLVGLIWPDDDDDDGGAGDTIAIDYQNDEQYHRTRKT